MTQNVQIPPAELIHQDELRFLQHFDSGPRPPGWRLTPRAVVQFIVGTGGEKLKLAAGTKAPEGVAQSLAICEKFVGQRELVERCVVTLASERGLLLVGEPGTAKSMLSELLAAAVSGTSALTVQGTAGTTEDQIRYGWNYALLMARGPHPEALVPSPVLTGLRRGAIVRIEEVTRCLPEVQDALISLLSDRRMAIPELDEAVDGEGGTRIEFAAPGFNVIATANLRDRGVSEMSAALKRRFNFEVIAPIADIEREKNLVRSRASASLARVDQSFQLDEAVLEALVTAFRDLRSGRTVEGWSVEKPTTVMSTAECVSVASSIGIQAAYFPSERDVASLIPGYLLGVVLKDDAQDRGRLLAYWDSAVTRRAEGGGRLWKRLLELRSVLEEHHGRST
ncbi:MAG: AAA family ATPase [Bradymonadaceae bacterium]|nr:AAA family ATPase [Lujinxingiaceae bacterium]